MCNSDMEIHRYTAIHSYIDTQAHNGIYMFSDTHVCVYMYIHIYIYIFCVYKYTYTGAEMCRQTDRSIGREIDRWNIGTETERWTVSEVERWRWIERGGAM